MTAGLQIFNANNIIQIDENYRCFAYKGKYSATANTLSFTTNGDLHEAVFVRVDGGATVIFHSRVGNTYTYKTAGNPGPTATITAYVFAAPTSIPAGASFEIYNSSGELVFSDLLRLMKPVASQAITTGTGSTTVTLPSGNYAATILSPRFRFGPLGNGGSFGQAVLRDGLMFTDTTITVVMAQAGFIPTNQGNFVDAQNLNGGTFTVIDVSLLN